MNRIVAILALAFAISPVAAQKVRVDFDHSNDFSHYQTYRWAGPPTGDDLNQLMQGRVVGFIEEALSARRLKRVQTGGDLVISANVSVYREDIFTTFTNSTGFRFRVGCGLGKRDIHHYRPTHLPGHTYRRRRRCTQEPAGLPRYIDIVAKFQTCAQHQETGQIGQRDL